MQIKLGVIEDDDTLRGNFEEFFNQREDFEVIFSDTGIKWSTLNKLTARPVILLLDLFLTSGCSANAINKLKQLFPQCKVIILSASSDEEAILNAINNGADGYLVKTSSMQFIADSLIHALNSGMPLSPVAAFHLFKSKNNKTTFANSFGLTKKEWELVDLLKIGISNKMAANLLGVTYFTINQHLKSIYKKLNINSKSELVFIANQTNHEQS